MTDPTVPSVAAAEDEPLLRPLPRREAVEAGPSADPGGRLARPGAFPRASLARTAWRAAWWSLEAIGLAGGLIIDRALGRSSPRALGARLRRAFQALGGTAIPIGQQLASRLDLLPVEVAEELSQLEDRAPPLPLEYALGRIEATLGRPIEEAFRPFDPEPIASLVTTCVYQAMLGERKVAVQVRRPRVAESLDADLRAISMLTIVLEQATLVAPGRFQVLRRDLRAMILDELDFQERARRQEVFRKQVASARLPGVGAPRVFRDEVGPDVGVNEFASGFFLAELLEAVESDDREALGRFAEIGIEPEDVARRLLHAFWWSLYEFDFFYADPHPSNLVVQAGGEILFLDFATCGSVPKRLRDLHLRIHLLLRESRVSEAASMMIQTLLPMPHIDVHEMTKSLETRLWTRSQAMRYPHSSSWERTDAGAWIALLDTSRAFGVAVRLDVVRMAHSTLLYDALAARLSPRLGPGVLEDYLRDQARRRRRTRPLRPGRVDLATSLDGLVERLGDVRFWMDGATADLPVRLNAMSSKASFAADAVLQLVSKVLLFFAVALAGITAIRATRGERADILGEAWSTLIHPVTIAFLGVLGLLTLRRIRFRLRDLDPES